jgi:hypothetical protein
MATINNQPSLLSTSYQFIWIERCKRLKIAQLTLNNKKPRKNTPNRRRKVILKNNPPPEKTRKAHPVESTELSLTQTSTNNTQAPPQDHSYQIKVIVNNELYPPRTTPHRPKSSAPPRQIHKTRFTSS